MKIVKFKDDTYGVRKWGMFVGYKFWGDNGCWWSEDEYVYVREYCHMSMGDALRSLKDAKLYMGPLKDIGEPI